MTGVLNPRLMIETNQIMNFDESRVQGNSVDLRVKEVYRIDGGITLDADNTRRLPPYVRQEPYNMLNSRGVESKYFRLSPEHLYQIEFYETVDLSMDVCALTFLRSSMFKSGASGETGLFDSGYSGGTGMTINVKFESDIEVAAAVAQLVFFSAEASHTYEGFYREKWMNVS